MNLLSVAKKVHLSAENESALESIIGKVDRPPGFATVSITVLEKGGTRKVTIDDYKFENVEEQAKSQFSSGHLGKEHIIIQSAALVLEPKEDDVRVDAFSEEDARSRACSKHPDRLPLGVRAIAQGSTVRSSDGNPTTPRSREVVIAGSDDDGPWEKAILLLTDGEEVETVSFPLIRRAFLGIPLGRRKWTVTISTGIPHVVTMLSKGRMEVTASVNIVHLVLTSAVF